MEKSLHGCRVVITGASSGIGRAAALGFARAGAHLALAARRAALLEEVAAECRAAGGRATAIPTDVTDPEAVRALARDAAAAMGGIDIWINNAGTGVFGPFLEADIALHRRTVEVNLLGAMHGAHAVLPVFERQGRGILVNTVSIGGWSPTPFAAAYTASKFGLRGFSASLRQELADRPGIHVCAVFPAIVDTPGLMHGANVSGRRINPGPHVYAPEDVAETFLALARHPREEVAVGWPSRAAQIAYGVAPTAAEHAIGTAIRAALRRAGPAPRTEGALLRPMEEGRTASGGWREARGLPFTARQADRAAAALLVGGILAIAGVAIARQLRSG